MLSLVAPSRHRSIGFADRTAGVRYLLPWFPLSNDPSRCSCRTTVNCSLYRSSHAGCRFGNSGSSGLVGRFLRLRWSSCILVPKIRAYRTYPTSGLEVSCGLRLLTLGMEALYEIRDTNY